MGVGKAQSSVALAQLRVCIRLRHALRGVLVARGFVFALPLTRHLDRYRRSLGVRSNFAPEGWRCVLVENQPDIAPRERSFDAGSRLAGRGPSAPGWC